MHMATFNVASMARSKKPRERTKDAQLFDHVYVLNTTPAVSLFSLATGCAYLGLTHRNAG